MKPIKLLLSLNPDHFKDKVRIVPTDKPKGERRKKTEQRPERITENMSRRIVQSIWNICNKLKSNHNADKNDKP